MTRIGLISDTHNFLDESVLEHFKKCDEIWHAGDFGNVEIAAGLMKAEPQKKGRRRTLRGVFGNIDGYDVKSIYPEQIVFTCEEVKVLMRHIGGYPPRYNPETKKELLLNTPQLFISGHSHILKVIYDEKLQCLHMNPGAAGREGWHKVRTVIRFVIDAKEIKDCEVIELDGRW
ncbi:MAG: metallophosphoesterase family protein [Ginsengibacter sp.]